MTVMGIEPTTFPLAFRCVNHHVSATGEGAQSGVQSTGSAHDKQGGKSKQTGGQKGDCSDTAEGTVSVSFDSWLLQLALVGGREKGNGMM